MQKFLLWFQVCFHIEMIDCGQRQCFTMCWLFGPIEMTCTLIIQPIFHFVFYEIPVYVGAHSKVMHFFLIFMGFLVMKVVLGDESSSSLANNLCRIAHHN